MKAKVEEKVATGSLDEYAQFEQNQRMPHSSVVSFPFLSIGFERFHGDARWFERSGGKARELYHEINVAHRLGYCSNGDKTIEEFFRLKVSVAFG